MSDNIIIVGGGRLNTEQRERLIAQLEALDNEILQKTVVRIEEDETRAFRKAMELNPPEVLNPEIKELPVMIPNDGKANRRERRRQEREVRKRRK